MSIQQGKLCSMILQQHFGDLVRIVGDDLYGAVAKTISMIRQNTQLSKKEITSALAILFKFRLAKFSPSPKDENLVEYALLPAKVLLLLRYSSYVHLMQTKYDHTAALLTGELLREGSDTISNLIVRTVLSSESKSSEFLVECKDRFKDLAQMHYFIRVPMPVTTEGVEPMPVLDVSAQKLFSVPELDLEKLLAMLNGLKNPEIGDENIHWAVNIDRFHQDFRDALLISAVERRIDSHAAECFRHILQIVHSKSEPWKPHTNPVSFAELRQHCEKRSNNLQMLRYLDQYLNVIEDDPLGFVTRSGDAGGGQYVVNMKNAFVQLAWALIEHVVTERFGSKAARIFRVVRTKRFIEQEDIQKEAMVPAKEAKLLTYKLVEENLLQIHTIRKAGGGAAGPAKAYYLFHIRQEQLVAMILEISYKALYNAIVRAVHDRTANKRLIDKSQRLESIIETMRERGESEDLIGELLETLTPPEREILQKVKVRVKNLCTTELGIDATIFLLQLVQYYSNVKV